MRTAEYGEYGLYPEFPHDDWVHDGLMPETQCMLGDVCRAFGGYTEAAPCRTVQTEPPWQEALAGRGYAA